MGVIGMNLDDGDEIIGMQLDHQGDSLLIVSENGMGKRTYLDEFTVQKRGGKGVKCYKITEKTGYVVGVKAVDDDHEIMMITTAGTIIQLRVAEISKLGRITSGVKLINLDDGVKVAQIAKVRERVSNGDQEFENPDDLFPTIYRVDRIRSFHITGEHFQVPYLERFQEGEFRKRVQFMYGGKLQKIRFKYAGPSIEAVLDRLPTAEIEEQTEDGWIVRAEVFGKGIDMWLRSQGDYIQTL